MKDTKNNNAGEQVLNDVSNTFDGYFIKSNECHIYKRVVTKIEKKLIEKALERTYGNQLKAAKILGLNRNTLHTKIQKLGIEVDRWKI